MRKLLIGTAVLALALTGCTSEDSTPSTSAGPSISAMPSEVVVYHKSPERKRQIEPAYTTVRNRMVEDAQLNGQLSLIDRFTLNPNDEPYCPFPGTTQTYDENLEYTGLAAFCNVQRDIQLIVRVKGGKYDKSSVVALQLQQVRVHETADGYVGTYHGATGAKSVSTEMKTVADLQGFDVTLVTALNNVRIENFGS